MTPERELYERERAYADRQIQAGRRELNELLLGAAECELVMTVETDPLYPPAMGHYDTVANVRLTRARQQRLEALLAAAEKSELDAGQ